ncbi:hypothetical protein [Enterococcus sp. S53]|uniref:hypothetical protein n=1 Tax=Enterococcus sp. S53 TaxID=2767453 RepID=UPI001906D410|nr:hypothetical protein [Enterococcus sp. S53]MBK0070946.1 hypothetical protein [Enterococcus sp. S53]
MHKNESNQINHEVSILDRVINEIYEKNAYGIHIKDFKNFVEELKSAKPNEKNNDFPDFLTPNGFIEHFQITSSFENKKGSPHKISMMKQQREHDLRLENMNEDQNKISTDNMYKNHSHIQLVNSFKKNFEKHLERLKSFEVKKDESIFLIEYDDINALSMCENIDIDLEEGILTGDIKINPEFFHNYRLSRDKELLKYISGFSSDLKYLIFVSNDIEIIATKKIDYFTNFIPNNYLCAENTTFSVIRTTRF